MMTADFKQSMAFAQAQQYATQHRRSIHLTLESPEGAVERVTVHPEDGVEVVVPNGAAEAQGDRTDTMYWKLSDPSAGIYNSDAPHPLMFIDYDDQGNICGLSFSGTLSQKSYQHGLDYALWLAGRSFGIGPGGQQMFAQIRRQVANTIGLKNYSLSRQNIKHEMIVRLDEQR